MRYPLFPTNEIEKLGIFLILFSAQLKMKNWECYYSVSRTNETRESFFTLYIKIKLICLSSGLSVRLSAQMKPPPK